MEIILKNVAWCAILCYFCKVMSLSDDSDDSLEEYQSELLNLHTSSQKADSKGTYMFENAFVPTNISCLNNNLIVTGQYIQFSEFVDKKGFLPVPPFCNFNRSTKQISVEVYASNTIFIDESIDGVGMQLNFVLIAPKLEIRGKRRINLDGEVGENHEELKALDGVPDSFNGKDGDGTDGLAGKPGGPGGNFFGVFGEIINGDKLVISVNGGDGGQGQDGGDGKYSSEGDFIANVLGLSDCHHGNGGNGGVGGKGGYPGNIILRVLSNEDDMLVGKEVKMGEIGEFGKGGKGSEGPFPVFWGGSGDPGQDNSSKKELKEPIQPINGGDEASKILKFMKVFNEKLDYNVYKFSRNLKMAFKINQDKKLI